LYTATALSFIRIGLWGVGLTINKDKQLFNFFYNQMPFCAMYLQNRWLYQIDTEGIHKKALCLNK